MANELEGEWEKLTAVELLPSSSEQSTVIKNCVSLAQPLVNYLTENKANDLGSSNFLIIASTIREEAFYALYGGKMVVGKETFLSDGDRICVENWFLEQRIMVKEWIMQDLGVDDLESYARLTSVQMHAGQFLEEVVKSHLTGSDLTFPYLSQAVNNLSALKS